jgi:hypothetical protein
MPCGWNPCETLPCLPPVGSPRGKLVQRSPSARSDGMPLGELHWSCVGDVPGCARAMTRAPTYPHIQHVRFECVSGVFVVPRVVRSKLMNWSCAAGYPPPTPPTRLARLYLPSVYSAATHSYAATAMSPFGSFEEVLRGRTALIGFRSTCTCPNVKISGPSNKPRANCAGCLFWGGGTWRIPWGRFGYRPCDDGASALRRPLRFAGLRRPILSWQPMDGWAGPSVGSPV